MKSPRAFLITGSSTGIGKACALALAAKGDTVFAGVRKDKDGESLVKESGGKVIPVILDVTDAASLKKAFNVVKNKTDKLDGLVNNAGIVVAGPLEFLDIDAFRLQLETNVTGLLASTQTFLPLVREGRGRIVNIGSLSGLVSTPFVGAYSASKFAVRAISDAMRLELKTSGIKVALIEPGPIATPIWEKSTDRANDMRKHSSPDLERYYGEALTRYEKTVEETAKSAVSVDYVVKAVLHSLYARQPKIYYPVGKAAKAMAAMSHWVPQSIMDRVITKGAGLVP